MKEIINNRQVNLWRGDKEPPTKYHIWIRDNKLLLFNGDEWVVFIDHYQALIDTKYIREKLDEFSKLTVNNKKIIENPVLNSIDLLVGKSFNYIKDTDTIQKALGVLDLKHADGYDINVIENADSSITIEIAGHSFTMLGTGSIDIRATGNNIIVDSNALSSIDAKFPLEWTKEKTLIHSPSGVKEGNYGIQSDQTRVSSFTSPYILVNETGHIVNIENKSITIRDYVEQLENNTIDEDKDVLLSFSDNKTANPVVKANGFKFNNKSQKLVIPGQATIGGQTEITGDLIVDKKFKIKGELEGSVTGTATPKIHTSKSTEYGPSSTTLYGHVIILDNLGIDAPLPSNTNKNPDTQEVAVGTQAVAASPLMVWNAREDSKKYTREYFSTDFVEQEGKVYLNWEDV